MSSETVKWFEARNQRTPKYGFRDERYTLWFTPEERVGASRFHFTYNHEGGPVHITRRSDWPTAGDNAYPMWLTQFIRDRLDNRSDVVEIGPGYGDLPRYIARTTGTTGITLIEPANYRRMEEILLKAQADRFSAEHAEELQNMINNGRFARDDSQVRLIGLPLGMAIDRDRKTRKPKRTLEHRADLVVMNHSAEDYPFTEGLDEAKTVLEMAGYLLRERGVLASNKGAWTYTRGRFVPHHSRR